MGKFKTGMFLGGILGAGLVWLSTTKKGRETRDQMLDHAGKVYSELKDKVLSSPQYKDLKKNEYVKMVKEYVDKYAIENGLADNVKNIVTKVVQGQWKNMMDK